MKRILALAVYLTAALCGIAPAQVRMKLDGTTLIKPDFILPAAQVSGLTAGGDYEPHNANLDALSAQATTAYGRALLDLANVASAQTYLQAAGLHADNYFDGNNFNVAPGDYGDGLLGAFSNGIAFVGDGGGDRNATVVYVDDSNQLIQLNAGNGIQVNGGPMGFYGSAGIYGDGPALIWNDGGMHVGYDYMSFQNSYWSIDQYGNASLGGGVVTIDAQGGLYVGAQGISTDGALAANSISSNYVDLYGKLQLHDGIPLSFNRSGGPVDVGISPSAPGTLAVGNGTPGDASGGLALGNLTASGPITSGSGAFEAGDEYLKFNNNVIATGYDAFLHTAGEAYVNTPSASTGYILMKDSTGTVYEIAAKIH